jgi:hypothetical protein
MAADISKRRDARSTASAAPRHTARDQRRERTSGSAPNRAKDRAPEVRRSASGLEQAQEDNRRTETDLHTTIAVRICPNPVFVIGSPRSGTSVLTWALAHSGEFWTSEETEFMHGLFGEGQPTKVYKDLCSRPRTFITRHGIDHKEFYAALGLGINALVSRRSAGKRWIDQSPGYTTMAWLLADMFPGARFLHVLRDGRAVVNSMLHFFDRISPDADPETLPAWAKGFQSAVETWKDYVEFALSFCERNPERCLTVRNEDLVEETAREFSRIYEFLGAKFNAYPIEFFKSSRVNSSFGPLVWGSGERTEDRGRSIQRATAIDAWRDWTPQQRKVFTKIAGDLIERLGYPDVPV